MNIGLQHLIFDKTGLKTKLIKSLDWTVGGALARLCRPKIRVITPPLSPDGVLIIRPGGLGDAVFLIPVIEALKDSHPLMKIDILCERRNEEVFGLIRHQLRDVYRYDSLADWKRLRRKRFDVIIDTEQWHYLSAVVSRWIPAEYHTGFATRRLRGKFFDREIGYDNNGYELDNFNRLFSFLTDPRHRMTDIDYSYDVSTTLMEWAAGQISVPSVAVMLGGSVRAKQIPAATIEILVRQIVERDMGVFLLGTPFERSRARRVCAAVGSDAVRDMTGRLSLERTAALIKMCRFYVGPDSGLTHLAASVGTPVIAFFGPSNKNKWAKPGGHHTVLTNPVPCSPCSRFSYTLTVCKERYPCLRDIPADKIRETVNMYIGKYGGR